MLGAAGGGTAYSLTLTSEDGGVWCITHTLDGAFEEANNSEKR